MAERREKKENQILKENLCCILFFLLLPLFALTLQSTPIGIGILIAAAALLILRFAVFDKPETVLTVGHFGWYLTISLIATIGIRIAAIAPVHWGYAGPRSFSTVVERVGVELLIGVGLFIVGAVLFSYRPNRTGRNLVRTIIDHLALVLLFWSGMSLFIPKIREVELLLFLPLFFILCDCYEQQRRTGRQRHTNAMLAAAVLYGTILLGTAFVPVEADILTLLGEIGVFGQLKAQLISSSVLWLVPMLYGLTVFLVCFKGSYAAQEVRYLGLYLVFSVPLFRNMLAKGAEYAWVLPLILTCVLLFCLFYPKTPSGAVEQKFAAHKEYRIAYAGIFLWLCMPALKTGSYLPAFVLAAFGLVFFALLQAKKLLKGSIVWQVFCSGTAITVWSMLYAAGKPVTMQLACGMIALLTASALWLYHQNAPGVKKRIDGWITAGIGVLAVMLQLAFLR